MSTTDAIGGRRRSRSVDRQSAACWVAGVLCLVSAAPAATAQSAGSTGFDSGASAVKRDFIGDEGLPWSWSFAANLETMQNRGGGLRDGTANGDLINLAFALNGDVIGLPAGSRFKVSAMSANSGFPTGDFVGDVQGVSNIEAEPATRIYQLWYRQQFRHVPVRLRGGLLDLNQYFDVTDSASSLLNSSFGINPAISGNVQTPVYPVPGWGVMSRWKRASWQLQGGLFSGSPDERSRLDPRPPLEIVELDLTPSAPADPRWMFGLWRKRNVPGATHAGLYAGVERSLTSHVRGFVQVGRTPGTYTQYGTAVQAGLDVRNPWTRRSGDEFAVGVARVSVRGAPYAESALEATYVFGIGKAVALQPDVQYVRHPAGELPSTWVLGLRVDIGLDRRSVMTAKGKD